MGTLKILRRPSAAWTLPCCMCFAVFTGAAFRQNPLQAVAFAAPVAGALPLSPAAQTPAATDTGVLQSESAARDNVAASGFFPAGTRDFNQVSSAPVPRPQTRPNRANLSQERLSETPQAVVVQTPPPETAVGPSASSISSVNPAGPAVSPTLIENTARSDVSLPRTQPTVTPPAQKHAETPVDVHRSSPVSFDDTQSPTVQPGTLGGTAALSAPDVTRENPEQFPNHLVQSNADQNGISDTSTLAPAGGNGVATLHPPRTPEAPFSPAQARNTEAAAVAPNPATVPGGQQHGNSVGSDEKGDVASPQTPGTHETRAAFLPASGSVVSAAEPVSGPKLEAREHTTDDALDESRKKLEALRNAAKAVEVVRAALDQPPFDAHATGSAGRYRAFDRTVPAGQETLPFERIVTAPTSTAAEDLTRSPESPDSPSAPHARTDSRSPSQQQLGDPGPHGRSVPETDGVELRDKSSLPQTSSDVPNSSARRDSPSHVSPSSEISLSPVSLPSADPRAGAPEGEGGTRVRSSEGSTETRADQETMPVEGPGDEGESPSEAKKAPPVLPTTSFFSICCLLAGLFVFACLASAGGIGGGSVFVALLVGLGHMQLAYAVPISKVMVFAASFCSFVLHRKLERQTAENARAVAQDWVDLLVPLALSGSLVGVVLNTILPGFYLLLLLSCLLFGLSARTLLSAMHLYRTEASLAVQQPFEEIFLPSPTTSPRRSSSSGSASPFHASCTVYLPDSQLSTDGSRRAFAVAATHCTGPPSPSFFPERHQDRASEEGASPSRLPRPPGSLSSEALRVPCYGEAEAQSTFIRSNGDEKDQEPFAAARSEETPVGLHSPREGRNPFSDEEAAEPFIQKSGESRAFERMHPEWLFPPGGNSNPVEEEDASAPLHGGEDGRQAGKGGAASGSEGFEPPRLDRRPWKEEAWRQTCGESERDTKVVETGSRGGKHGERDREAEPESEEGSKEGQENGTRSGKRSSREARAGTTVDVESVSSPEALDSSTRNGRASGVDSVPSAAPIPPSSSSPAYPAFPRFYSLEDEEDLTHISFMQTETSEGRGSLPASVFSALDPALDSEFLAALPDRNAARGPLSKALNLLRSACEGMVSSAQDDGASSFSSGQTPIDPTLLLPSASTVCPGTNLEASSPHPVSPRFASTEHLASYQRLSGGAKRREEEAPEDRRGATEGQGVARREPLVVDTSVRLLRMDLSSEASLGADPACHGGLVAWLRASPGFAKARKAVGQVERLCFQRGGESPHYFVLLLLLLVHVFASSLLHLLLKHGARRAAAVVAALALLLGASVQLRLSVLIFRKHFPAGTAPPAPTLRETLSAVSASVAALWRRLKKVGRAAGKAAFAVGEFGKNALHRSGLFAAAPASVALLEHDSGRDSIEVAELSVRGRFRNAGENPFLCAVGDIQEIRLSEESGQENLSHLSLDLTGVRQSGDDRRGHFSKKSSGARPFDEARNQDCPAGVDDAVPLSWTSVCFEGYRVSPVAALPPLLLTPFIGFLTGVFAGLVGIGGGVVFSPFLLLMGNDPVSAVATASACVVFTSSSTSLQFLLIGRLPILYASLFGLVAAAAAACATCGIHRLRRAVGGRMSVIAGCVASAVAVASALTVWRCIEVGIYGE